MKISDFTHCAGKNWVVGLSGTLLFVTPYLAVAAPTGIANPTAPTVSQCKLETTQRIAFRVDNAPKASTALGLRLRFYDSTKAWMADELIYGDGVDTAILPVAGLLDPRKVAAVTCSIDGYVGAPDPGFISIVSPSTPGRKACSKQNGLWVDGGPDAYFAAAVVGKGWVMAQFLVSINHFFPDQESEFSGDIFSASLDRGPEQKVVVSGQDPQSISYLFTSVQPGPHQIDYGPWTVYDAVRTVSPGYSPGYHNVCLRV